MTAAMAGTDRPALVRWRWTVTTAFGLGGIAVSAWGPRLRGWLDWRLLLIGVVMLGVELGEGSAGNWLTLAARNGHGQTAAVDLAYWVSANHPTTLTLPSVHRWHSVVGSVITQCGWPAAQIPCVVSLVIV